MLKINSDNKLRFNNLDLRKIEPKSTAPVLKENKSDLFIFDNNGINCADLFNNVLIDIKKVSKNDVKSTHFADFEDFTREEILRILQESKDLTLSSGSLLKEFYDKNNIYDFPLRFASACYNSRDIESGYIDDKTPEIFKGIDKKELFSVLDNYSMLFRNGYLSAFEPFKVQINFKDFYFKPLGQGAESCAFIISDSEDNNDNSVVFKIYYNVKDGIVTFAPCGFYGNIGMLREANMAGVVDVPELYFANPVMSYSSYEETYKGCWAVVENAKNKEIKDGLKLPDWLKNMGLFHVDDRSQNRINGVCVDLGFIKPLYDAHIYQGGWGDKNANEIYGGYLDGKTTQDLINSIVTSDTFY